MSQILMIAPAPFEFDRGKSLRIRQSVQQLTALGHDIDIVTYPNGDDVAEETVQVSRATHLFAQKDPSKPGFSARQMALNIDLLRLTIQKLGNHDYDVIHTHDVDGALIGHSGRTLRGVDIPLVYDMHGTFNELNRAYDIIPFELPVRWAESNLERVSDFNIANWPHVADSLDDSTPSSLIFDEPDETVRRALQQDLQPVASLKGERYVLYTGNYADYQGINLLLESFERANTDARLVLTGTPPEKYRVDNDSVIYPGFVDEWTLAQLLQNANVLVSPRQTDGFPPMKILYYVLTSNPIVVTDRSCHRSVLDSMDGILFCAESPTSFAEGITQALESDITYEREPLQSDVTDKYNRVYQEVGVHG
jgi:glycosyltransferase involved in cell wall biosynthesis